MAIASITPTAERAEKVDFTQSYLQREYRITGKPNGRL
ncbi:MAG TPA: hypothetical protein DCS42_15630 [Nitrospiraceae bacterium]|nr:hypothetical protein [Nitrospiraceae bacterium]HAS55453.1 hypothetical protein [Nitrospiraceae bacterium]